jgi:cytochrome c551/c552
MNRITKIVLGVIVGAVALFALIQLIPTGVSYTNPPVVSEPNWGSPQTRALAQRACFDCHSNETTWPWYSKIAPVSWLVAKDVNEGRQKLNFSDWARAGQSRRDEDPQEEIVRNIENGSMPPWYYTLLHPTASLSAEEKQQLINAFKVSAP